MTVTVRSLTDLCAFARFTWSDDLQDCTVLALGVSDAQLDAIMEGKGHEGEDVDGYSVELVWSGSA